MKTSALNIFDLVLKYFYLLGRTSEAFYCNDALLHTFSQCTSCCGSPFPMEQPRFITQQSDTWE